MKLSPLILSRRENVIRWPEVNKWPYWFMWECKQKGLIKVSPYAECYSLSSLFLTIKIKTYYPVSINRKCLTKIKCNKSYFIIIMSCLRHGYPWPSLATSPYRSSPLEGLQGLHPISSHSCWICLIWSSCFCPAICGSP